MKQNISESDHKILVKIGQQLKDKREETGYSHKKVSDITRISSMYIKGIESGDYTVFSSLVFVKGFLRNYCQLLSIDPNPFLDEYNRIFNPEYTDEPLQITKPLEDKAKISGENQSRIMLLLTGLIFLAVIGGLLFYYLYFSFYAVTVPGSDPIQVSTSAETEDSQNSAAPSNTAKKETAQSDEIYPLNLRLSAKNGGWIRLNIDDENEFDIFLESQRAYRWDAKKSFALVLSRGDIADVYFNDELQEIDDQEANKLVVFELK